MNNRQKKEKKMRERAKIKEANPDDQQFATPVAAKKPASNSNPTLHLDKQNQ